MGTNLRESEFTVDESRSDFEAARTEHFSEQWHIVLVIRRISSKSFKKIGRNIEELKLVMCR